MEDLTSEDGKCRNKISKTNFLDVDLYFRCADSEDFVF